MAVVDPPEWQNLTRATTDEASDIPPLRLGFTCHVRIPAFWQSFG
jgi:hypothetical protein